MKNIFNKLKKTISFYILILSILFFLVALVFKCIYLYEYKTLQNNIMYAINKQEIYSYTNRFGNQTNIDFTDKYWANYWRDKYETKEYIHYMLKMHNKDSYIYYNNISNKILVACVCCFLFFGYLCYIKLRPERKIKFSESDINNTMSYSYDKPVVECPYCHSKDTKKISGLSKVGSVALFGIFALEKTSKQFHCNHCGADF